MNETYVLFLIDEVASGIVNAKFKRKKETDDYIFLSLPENYEINCQVRDFIDGKWQTTKKWVVKAKDLKAVLKDLSKK